jgi:DNA-binding NarL/FixJ family response regulator
MKILIADDHDVYRAGLSLLLQKQPRVCDVVEAYDFDAAVDCLASSDYAVAFFDLNMPGMFGARTLMHVREVYPNVALAIISADGTPETMREMLDAGAQLYLPKSISFAEMAEKIGALIAKCAGSAPVLAATAPVASNGHGLTPRQMDVLKGIARGLTNKEIARDLGIAPGTVKIHLAALFDRFDAGNRTELLIRAKALVG